MNFLVENNSSSSRIGVVILAGGQGRRMGGRDKAVLTLSGKTFLKHMIEELSEYPELLLAVGERKRLDIPESGLSVLTDDLSPLSNLNAQWDAQGIRQVVDAAPSLGPLSGLVAALRECRSTALFAVAVDMPLFKKEVGAYLADCYLNKNADNYDVVVAVGRDGRIQPLCAIYDKLRALPVLERQLAEGNGCLTDALGLLRTLYAPMGLSSCSDSVLLNVNHPEEYAALIRGHGLPL